MSAFEMTPLKAVAVLAGGMLFGFGLSLSAMIQPEVVLSFLTSSDLGLMLVMGGALCATLLTFRLAPRLLRQPLLGGHFHRHVSLWNRDTLIGAALFGAGWGLCGVCPGPAIAGLGTGNTDLIWALAGIFAGALLQGWRARH
ncbi:MAG: YeeE/YedE family protein [Hydrogenophaga sp.]|nr:YeeE/YedE family protein [Hydrogenophaga sp.]